MLILLLVIILAQFASSAVGFYWLEKKLNGSKKDILNPLKKIVFPNKEEVMEWVPPQDKETEMSIRLTESLIGDYGRNNKKKK